MAYDAALPHRLQPLANQTILVGVEFGQKPSDIFRRHSTTGFSIPQTFINGGKRFHVLIVGDGSGIL
ncbi:MAG: hypothetical protein WCA92_15740 [Terriglobales bacterium]